MKILHVYKTFINDTQGGVEQVIAQLCATSKNPAFDHTVLSLTRGASDRIEGHLGIKNIRYHEQLSIASNSMSWQLWRDFPKLVKDYDVIHYHFPWPFADLLHWHWQWQTRKPSVVTYHSDVIRQKLLLRLYSPLMHKFLQSAHAIVATSPGYLATSPVLQRYRDKTTMIPLGIERLNYPALDEGRVAYWRERLGERFFLFVGMLRYYKGLPVLLEALRGTDYPLVLIGHGHGEQALHAQARQYQLKNVHFLKHISEEDKIALLHLCLAFVFPSIMRSEAFGVSLLEAAMLGKPMISTELGTGTSYVNEHDVTGLVIPPNDVAALRNAMTHLWNHPDHVKAMGEAAALRYQQLFTAQTMIEAYENLYQQVTKE
jgi:glycosyltransferase involved in cell wall biosynthesis